MSFFQPRNIWLVIMVAAIGVSMYVREESKTPDIEVLKTKQISMMVKMLASQALVVAKVPGPLTDGVKKQIKDQLGDIETKLPEREIFPVQKFIILSEIGESVSLPDMGNKALIADLKLIYVDRTPAADNSPLFAIAGGDLARLKSLSLNKPKEAEALRADLEARASFMEMVLGGSAFFGLGVFFAGLAVTYWFFRKIPPAVFFESLGLIDPERQRLLLESAVLYVFLVFPVGAAFGKQVAHLFPNATLFALVHLTIAFFASCGYYAINAGQGSLRMLAIGQVTDPMKEVAVGVMGFAAIFPPALLALLLTMGSVAQDSVRIAHPISFEIQKNPVLVFILAAVLVPIFEEVIFRCFLYGFFRREQRIRYAAFFSGSIFAILHPQGAIALPYLTILGMGLAVLREYRPSPLASMTAHACVNGTAVVLGYAFTAL